MTATPSHPSPMTLRHGFSRCSLGLALVVMASDAVVALFLGDDEGELLASLPKPLRGAAALAGDDPRRALVAQAGKAVDDPAAAATLPVALQGTPLQVAVWRALQTIPVGETRTYTELAAMVGRPDAVRAVAGACGANRLAVVVPCHRAVPKGGGLAGFRWGVERKRQLLEREGALRGRQPTLFG